MKYISAISSVFLLSCLSDNETFKLEENVKSPLKINVEVLNWKDKDSLRIFELDVSLSNNTNKTLEYLQMSCSIEEFFELEANSLFSIYNDDHCYSNFPVVENIKVGEKDKYKVKVSIGTKEFIDSSPQDLVLNYKYIHTFINDSNIIKKINNKKAYQFIIKSNKLQL